MNIFGKNKNQTPAEENDMTDNTTDIDAADDFDKETPLAAPTRPAAGGGKKTGLLLGLLVLVGSGVGGGYYYMNELAAPPMPPRAPIQPQMATAQVPSPVLDMPDMPVPPPADLSALPPMPDIPGIETTPELSDSTASEMPGEATAEMPPGPDQVAPEQVPADTVSNDVPDALQDVTGLEDTPDLPDAEDIPPEALQIEAAPETTMAASPPESAFDIPPMPASASDLQINDTQSGPEAAAAETPVPPVPAADLPVPADMVAAPAEATIGDVSSSEVAGQETSAPAAQATPTEGEQAIVDNAGLMEGMTAPTTPFAQQPDLATQEAMIRPLPKQYLVVKKNTAVGDVDSRLSTARTALSQNRTAAALQLFDELSRDFPKDKRVLMGRALALQKMGRDIDALGAYENVLTHDPKNIEALTNMLGILKKENPSMAVDRLLELREAYPHHADIAAQLGIAYADSGAFEEGLKYLDIAESLNPGNDYVLFNKAVLYDKMGRSGEAAELYRHILRMASDGTLRQTLPLDVIRQRLGTMR